MKRILLYIQLSIFLISTGCTHKEDLDSAILGNGNVVLEFSVNGAKVTKAGETSYETDVTHLDIFFFDQVFAKERIYRRVNINPGNDAHIVPDLKVSQLENASWYVYIVANSRIEEGTFNGIQNVDALERTVETTEYVYITGTDFTVARTGSYLAPQTFLMTGKTEITTFPNPGQDLTLENISLTRSVAKTVINFNREKVYSPVFHSFGMPAPSSGIIDYENITLSNIADSDYSFEHTSYYLRNLPYKTYLWPSNTTTNSTLEKRKTNPITNSGHLSSSQDIITIVVYVYSCSWNKTFSETPCVIVNLPAVQKINDGYGKYLERNYYEIPLRFNETQVESNHKYEININVNAPGGLTAMEPVPLVPVEIKVYPWNNESIEVGSEAENNVNNVEYLNLSKYSIEMRNVKEISNSIKFASSSPIDDITLVEAYHIDKFGIKQDDTDNIEGSVEVEWEKDVLNGYISTIETPIPENNATRFMTFEARNEDGIIKRFTVMQYPLLYINNIVGWFSYRKDVKNSDGEVTHLLNRNSDYRKNITSTDGDSFGFRVARNINTDGTANIYNYVPPTNGWLYIGLGGRLYNWDLRTLLVQGGSATYTLNNARMYHVTVSATSDDYVLGKPEIDANGYTATDENNARTVSPSFIIASQLGTLKSYDSINNYEQAQIHCKNYVETYIKNDDGDNSLEENRGESVVHLDGWRLPTREEIKIIALHQTTSDAMDDLLIGQYYFCASPDKAIASGYAGSNSSGYTGYWTRCVRDAYDNQIPVK